jgi:outer membrane protein TolC
MENTRFPGQGSLSGLDREISAYATLPLEPFLQRSSRLAQVNGEIRAAQATVSSTEQQVALDAAHAFFRVALAQASVDAVKNRAAVDRLIAYLRDRVTQGANPEGVDSRRGRAGSCGLRRHARGGRSAWRRPRCGPTLVTRPHR